MKRALSLVLLLMFLTTPALAYNIEMLDEITYGAKIQSQDIILKSKYVDIGAEIGTTDLNNSDSIKNGMFAMGVVTIKCISLFDLTK